MFEQRESFLAKWGPATVYQLVELPVRFRVEFLVAAEPFFWPISRCSRIRFTGFDCERLTRRELLEEWGGVTVWQLMLSPVSTQMEFFALSSPILLPFDSHDARRQNASDASKKIMLHGDKLITSLCEKADNRSGNFEKVATNILLALAECLERWEDPFWIEGKPNLTAVNKVIPRWQRTLGKRITESCLAIDSPVLSEGEWYEFWCAAGRLSAALNSI